MFKELKEEKQEKGTRNKSNKPMIKISLIDLRYIVKRNVMWYGNRLNSKIW